MGIKLAYRAVDILKYLTECNRPRTLRKIANALRVEGSEGRQALLRRIKAMQRDGQIILNRRGGYGLINKMDLYQGLLLSFGWLRFSLHRKPN